MTVLASRLRQFAEAGIAGRWGQAHTLLGAKLAAMIWHATIGIGRTRGQGMIEVLSYSGKIGLPFFNDDKFRLSCDLGD